MTTKDELKLALHKAFDLGSRYWQQADSEYSSQWKKADATRAQLDQLIEDTAKQARSAPVQEPFMWACNSLEETVWETSKHKECEQCIPLYTTPPAQPAPVQEPLSELEKDAANLLFALHDAWPYVHGHCTIESRKKAIQALIVKHGDFADLHPPAAPVQPVAFFDWYNNAHWGNEDFKEGCHRSWNAAIKYITPPAAPVNQRAHEMALRQWESWKQYALELQEKLVKYEGGAPMVLNTTPQPRIEHEPENEPWVSMHSKPTPVQEPVAWYRDEDGIRIYYESKVWDDATPLYTTPPAQPAPVQEPVGEVVVESMGVRGSDAMRVRMHFYKEIPPVGSKIYTTPPAAQRLEAEVLAEREACWRLCDALWIEGKDAHDCREAIRARGNT